MGKKTTPSNEPATSDVPTEPTTELTPDSLEPAQSELIEGQSSAGEPPTSDAPAIAGDDDTPPIVDDDVDERKLWLGVPLKAPAGVTGCTVDGYEYDVVDGIVDVDEAHVAELLSLGFTL